MKVILGSQSPRRREILSYFNLPFEQMSSGFDEEALPFNDNPEEYVCLLSQGKALNLSSKYPDAIVITADTIVYRNGRIYGKPRDLDEALASFSSLAGQWHTVFTGVTIQQGKKVRSQAEPTKVLFNAMTQEQISHYLSKVEWADKAGGYAIQMAGGLIVRRIEGCYYNVMGLPINTLEELLRQFGIELWDYL